MPDIFISYSRKDSEQAEQLAERLRTRGIDVWIDKSGIEAAKSWSKEIVRAIDECKAFVVLISSNSQASENVSREVGIASESKKPMLPIALEDIKLSDELRYHLSGIQRVAYTQFDAIAQALENFGIARGEGRAGGADLRVGRASSPDTPPDTRKSLMILPFQDLSPTGDNGWFADGIVSELISALSNVKALRISDAQATKDYKRYQGTLPNYAREMSIRYFVEGDVRKFGDNIKITSRLLDIETGDHLWQDSMKGTMSDIFDIQEKVAEKVVEGLKVHLASDENKKLAKRGTENAEAYELYLRAMSHFDRWTKGDLERALFLLNESIRLDPHFRGAVLQKCRVLRGYHKYYTTDPKYLAEQIQILQRLIKAEPEDVTTLSLLAGTNVELGNYEEAERLLRSAMKLDPESPDSYAFLAGLRMKQKRYAEAIEAYERHFQINPQDYEFYFRLRMAYAITGNREGVRKTAERAIPYYERGLLIAPDNIQRRGHYADMLLQAGRREEAFKQMDLVLKEDSNDVTNSLNIACFYATAGEIDVALDWLEKSILPPRNPLTNLEAFTADPDLFPLHGNQRFEAMKRKIENEVTLLKGNTSGNV